MSTELSNSTTIDRLSSLPPELLSVIFDLAHDPEYPLLEPLSKVLLPYHRQTLYRQIRISSSSSLSNLLAAVGTAPSLAQLVQNLTVRFGGWLENAQFESIANRFRALKSLDYGRAQFSKVNFVAPLRSLSYSPLVFNSDEIDALSRLPLIKLEVKLYISKIEIPDNLQTSTTVPLLEELTLVEAYATEDEDQWDPEVSRFVKNCPKLRSLKLVDEGSPRFEKFLETLVGGVPHLTKLEFDTPALEETSLCRFTHLYPLFPNLTYLGLGEGATAPNLASHLRHLSYLSTVRLGPEAHFGFESAEDLFSLVRTPTKPPALKLLILDCFDARIGFRCDTQDELVPRELANSHCRRTWIEPSFPGNFGEEECRELLELARANEVRVEGDIYTAVRYRNSWNLERSNRQVLYAFQNQTLELLRPFQKSSRGARFRKLDLELDKLDLNNLKLVKVDLPEEDWFRFTLE